MNRSCAHSIAGCLLATTLVAAGCGGKAAPPEAERPELPARTAEAASTPSSSQEAAPAITPQDAPDSLFAVVTAAHPVLQMRSVAALVDAVQPGAGAEMEASTVFELLSSDWGQLPASAFDLEKPLYLLFGDTGSSPVLVAAVADPEALAEALAKDAAMRVHQSYAALGDPEAVDALAGYALTRLREQPVPPSITLDMRLEQIMARHGAAMSAALHMLTAQPSSDEMQRKILETYVSFMDAILHQTASMRATVEAGAAGVTLQIALRARPDTTLATFARGQTPSQYAMLSALARSEDDFFLGGRIDYTAIPAVFEELWGIMLARDGLDAGASEAVRASMRGWLDMFRDELAVSGRFDDKERLSMRMRTRIADETAARTLLQEWQRLVTRYPTAFNYRKPRTRTVRQQGVPVYTLRAELEGTAEEQDMLEAIYGPRLEMAIAVAGGHLSAAVGQSALREIRDLLADAPPAESAHPALSEGRARQESMIVYVDLAGLAGRAIERSMSSTLPGMSMGLGFEEATTRLRITVPTSQILGLMAMNGSP